MSTLSNESLPCLTDLRKTVYVRINKLRKATIDAATMRIKYDPMGNRIWKQGIGTAARKYIVDISAKLPTILCEIDSEGSLTKSYIYTDKSRILAQRNGGQAAAEYFYVTDRLGSVRQLIDDTGSVVRNYTYSPFGQLLEEGSAGGAPANRFMFTGQWFDDEIEQYYLRARMYDPNMMRFTARDPVRGKYNNPMTFHVYLYCLNDPMNRWDPSGEFWGLLTSMYTRAKDASVSVGSYLGAKRKIYAMATLYNATLSGTMNMWLGPDSVSDAAKFAIGFVAGAVEMQVGLRGNATAGAFVGSVIENTGNQLLAEDKSLGWAAIDIALSTGLGKCADWMEPEDIQAIEMALIGLDVDLLMWTGQRAEDVFGD